MNRVHFHDIADEAGVSVRTLYRVMNNQGAVSSATRCKVVTALNRYGYLCSGQKEAQTILFDIVHNSFIERVGILLMQRLSLRNFHCVLSNHIEQKEHFLNAVSQVNIVVTCSFPTEALLQEIRITNPTCTIINIFGGGGGDVAIDSDDYLGGQLAARHLFANGHRHVGIFSSFDQPHHIERYKSFLGQMLFLDPSCKVEFHEFFPETNPGDFWMNYFRANKQLPSGFFCPRGGLADFLPYCLEKLKLKIPEDISLIGYNRPEERNYIRPLQPFDSVVFDIEQLTAWGEYYILNRPMVTNQVCIHSLLQPILEIKGSVRNINS